ncbi:MAG: hypothetical protein KAR40_06790, partial [Candidatus Sabulitectum sp.]|nr:hypothetical protein [Candidatus Sabulitectum sp.]
PQTDLGAIFGDSEPETPEPQSAEAPTEGVPSVSTGEAQDVSIKEPEEVESPAEITVEVPIVQDKAVKDSDEKEETSPEPVEEAVEYSDSSCYTLLPGDGISLCVMKLEDGEVRVIRGLVTAMDGSVSLDGEVLSGNGLVWMGQGNLTPVVVKFKEGMTVRIDRMAARPVQVTHEACGIGSVPSLCKLNGSGNSNRILMFVTGRIRKLTVTPGLRVREGSVVVADPGVSFTEEKPGFLSVSGKGMVIITG